MASLACTACRAKKQRCDRRHACNAQTLGSLASTQTNTGGMLRRLQANQPHRRRADWLFDRGLPAGFLNAMQSRLRDTELALFRALAELYEGTVDGREYDGLSAGRLQTKSDMMEEWSSLPLREHGSSVTEPGVRRRPPSSLICSRKRSHRRRRLQGGNAPRPGQVTAMWL
ncbi:hypothetical protein F4823DRAFT_567951 [Ustulina deusta]|nr:hypothetical protein F4823DRAFT_567951 [Ustulina deusta]